MTRDSFAAETIDERRRLAVADPSGEAEAVAPLDRMALADWSLPAEPPHIAEAMAARLAALAEDAPDDEATEGRSYAGTRERVATGVATPSKRGAISKRATATRTHVATRATRELVQAARTTAPKPIRGYVSEPTYLDELAELYSKVTGRPVERVSPRMRGYLAVIHRLHGDRLEQLLVEGHREDGEVNLLYKIRSLPPDDSDLIEGLDDEYGPSAYDVDG